MKKTAFIIIIIACILAFCGCGNALVTCSLSEDNVAQMKIELAIDKTLMSGQELESANDTISELQRYLENTGFKTEIIKSGGALKLNITKKAIGRTPKEGFDKLMAMMRSDNSPFSYVEGGYSQSYFEDIYNLGANVDLTKIVDYEYIDSLPESQKNKILEVLDGFSGTVVFDLKGEITEHTGSVLAGNNSVDFDLEGPVQIKSVMTIQNTENIQNYEKLKAEIAQLETEKSNYTLYLVITSCIIVALVAAMLIIVALKKKPVKTD